MNITAMVMAAVLMASNVGEMVIPKLTEIHEEAEAQITEADVEILAKLVWGEARGIDSDAEKAAVIWCVLNRLDAGFENSIRAVVTAPSQFTGYRSSNPATEEFKELAEDVLKRYYLEKAGVDDVGRTLPNDYKFFRGYNGRNWFRQEYRSATRWDWSLPSPYEE